MNTIIDFFVPGFSKCGTTTLFTVLNNHPGIFIPEFKEPNYFGASPSAKKSAWFESLYEGAKKDQLKGDCSTFYSSIFLEDSASKAMFANNPDAKLIFIARDPIERIESSFREMHNSAPKFGLNTPFHLEDALIEMPQIIEDTSYFLRQQPHKKLFGEENVLVIFLEDLQTRTSAVADRCYAFLGAGKHIYTANTLPHMNRGEEKLYDSRLFRRIRCHPVFGIWLSKIGIPTQDRIAIKIGLRKPFTHTIEWSEKAKSLVKDRLGPDIDAFLEDMGEERSRWPRYESLYNVN